MEAALRRTKRDLLAAAGLAQDLPARRLRGGRNNRVWRLGLNGSSLLLKAYFHGPGENRDRLAVEWGFLNFAWEAGLRDLPRPVAASPAYQTALLGFLPGRRLRRRQADSGHVVQAADFVARLNRRRDTAKALELPLASDACPSLAAHMACLRRRLRLLSRIEEPAARGFALGELAPAGKAALADLDRWTRENGIAPERTLGRRELCISPSDFGFQNALVDEAGRLRFLDFEYAGWDDPAKLTADFFAQPEVIVETTHLEPFVQTAFGQGFRAEVILRRARAVLPLHWVKWCCILLGEFLPGPAGRRAHARDQSPSPAARARQLAKARAHLRRLPRFNPTR